MSEQYVINVSFTKCRKKLYTFSTQFLDIKDNDLLIVDTLKGLSIVYAAGEPYLLDDNKLNVEEMKPIVRVANEKDIQNNNENIELNKGALIKCQKYVEDLKLEMYLVSAEYSLDRSKITITYVANERVDFRELLKVLAGELRCRIELRQIGPRDKAKIVGGIGNCGLETCCSRFLGAFDVISINMAKNQLLALNVQKLSGQCGKLMCCLKYEDEIYKELRKGLPKLNSQVRYKNKTYRVTSINFLSNQIKLDNKEEQLYLTVDDLRFLMDEQQIITNKKVDSNDADSE
ncbi:MAG: regulatory iron-sulfur-containing complex subunit RicT [Erysipelotrichaceae bacterium]